MNEFERKQRWKRYGLSLSPEMRAFDPVHARSVESIHNAVCEYLDSHPEVNWGQPGAMYFDIAELAVGEARVLAVSMNARAVSERMRQRHEDTYWNDPLRATNKC